MASRYRFQASAIGAAGRITLPFQELIEVQASSALPEIGGYGSAISSAFNHRQLVSFDVAHSEVTGSETVGKDGNPVYSTLVKSTVEGLNVMGMVTADRVVARLVKTFRVDPTQDPGYQQSFTLAGTRFENLKIAGMKLDVDLALEVFDQCNSFEDLPEAYRSESQIGRGITSVSLVRRGDPKTPGFYGQPIQIEGFGTIRLAELEIGMFSRRVNMLEIDLSCPVEGRVMACSIIGDGSDL